MIDRILQGDQRSIAQAISLVENDIPESAQLLRSLYSQTGRAYRIGITGPPGAGKSTLVNKLARHYRSQNLKVGIIAVDPSSPFTGGALLGDRVRMSDIELDEGIFIRSMASRGSLGGLSKKAKEAADILDAAGFDILLMETVGVGQSELDIADTTDTTVVVLVPESGDGIQAMKAGLMEIADLFVMNKADRPGVDHALAAIDLILGFQKHDKESWLVKILKAQANEGIGVSEIAGQIEKHKGYLQATGTLVNRRRVYLKNRIREIIDERWHSEFWTSTRTADLEEQIHDVLSRSLSPYDVAEKLMHGFKYP